MRGSSLRPYCISLWLFSSTYILRTSSRSKWVSIFCEHVVLMMDAGTGEVGDGNPRRPCGSGLGFKPCWPVRCGNENPPIVFWAGITYMIYLRVSAHHLREIPARLGRRQEITTFPRDPSQSLATAIGCGVQGPLSEFSQRTPKADCRAQIPKRSVQDVGSCGGWISKIRLRRRLTRIGRPIYANEMAAHSEITIAHLLETASFSCLHEATGLCGLLRTTCWAFRTAWPAQPINPSTA